MRCFLSVLLLLLSVELAHAEGFVIGSYVASPSCSDSSCTGFIVCQNFEGTGYDNSETWTESIGTNGIVNEDDTTSTVLRGSQQLKIYAGDASKTSYSRVSLVSDRTEIWGHIKVRFDASYPYSDPFFLILDSGYGITARLSRNTNGTLKFYQGTSIATTTDATANNTDYHIWFHFTSGSGTGAGSVGFSTTTTEPTSGTKYASYTGATSTAARYVEAYQTDQTTTYFDQVLVKTTSIGTVCD
jgi:hypothetical protein